MISRSTLTCAVSAILLALTASSALSATDAMTPAAIHCLETVPTDPKTAATEAQSLYKAGDKIGARRCLGDALVAQGEVTRGARILDELARDVAKARDMAPAVQGAIWGDAGRAWLEADDVPKALAALDAAIQHLPKDMNLRVDRAVALGSARRYWDAIDDLNAAISNGIDTTEAFLLRATAWREVGTAELAMEDIKRALAKAPNDPEVLLERGRIRKLANDVDGARSDFLAVIKLAPSTSAGAAARHELQTLTGRQKR